MFISNVLIEYRENPIGIGSPRPRFCWSFESHKRNVKQTAYQLQTVEEGKPWEEANWDSGWVETDQSVHVEYDGPPLRSGKLYRMRVRVCDNYGTITEWHDRAYWLTGKLSPKEWSGQWIAASNEQEEITMLRRSFELKGSIALARLFVTARGLYEVELNGVRVGSDLFTPGWTSYRHRLQTQTYDVTDMIRSGENAIGANLANGWYKGDLGWKKQRNLFGDRRALLLELELLYESGESERIISDEHWKWQTGPILYSELYHGETYDARLERNGWSEPGYSAEDWLPVQVLTYDISNLIHQENVPTRVVEDVLPVAVVQAPNGDTLIDFGQNMVGWVQFSVEGANPGDEVVLQHAEVLDKEGNFYSGNLRSARQIVKYICNGDRHETFHPRFSFQGFRYVRVVSHPGEIQLHRFVGKVIYSDMETTGNFECSEPLINQLQKNIVWGQRGNFLDVPTDCPQRDERLGWTGDAQVFIRTAAFNMQIGAFFTKWLRDLKADQLPDGGVPHVIPDVPELMGNHSSSAWGDAAVICPWVLYLSYGDKRILEEQFDSMKGWVDYIRQQGDDPLLWNTGFHFGDWLAMDATDGTRVGSTPTDLIATAFFAYSTSLVSKAAAVLGREAEAKQYSELHQLIIQRFRHEFVTPSGRIAAPTQTAHVLPLMFGLVEGESKRRITSDLASMIRAAGNKLTTGFVGTPYLCHVLSENGELDLAYKLLLQEEFPSWLFSIRMGATTIWEHWDGIKEDGSFWSDMMNSYNHYAYGSIGEWMYRVVAGLDLDEQEPGFKRIRIQPKPGGGLHYAKAEYKSLYGTIRSFWEIDKSGDMNMYIVIPPNTSASVLLPFATASTLVENGIPVTDCDGVSNLIQLPDGLSLELGSGEYRFEYPYRLHLL